MDRIGDFGATTDNVGSNCDTTKEAQTKQETEEVERKRNRLVTGERTEQPMGERFPLEQETAKERVLKEYEGGVSRATCHGLFRFPPHSLPEQLKEGKMEHDQTGDS